jgi:hypothetical protein
LFPAGRITSFGGRGETEDIDGISPCGVEVSDGAFGLLVITPQGEILETTRGSPAHRPDFQIAKAAGQILLIGNDAVIPL